MTETVVHRLYEEFTALRTLLADRAEPSLGITADDCFRKSLLLAAASYFETLVVATIVGYVDKSSQQNALVREFVKQKGLNRQYHTLFEWEKPNANRFFSFFGDAFKRYAEDRVRSDASLAESIKSFLEIGRERNRLVHQDFGNFTLEKTADEIFEAFLRARAFVAGLPSLLDGCPKQPSSTQDDAA